MNWITVGLGAALGAMGRYGLSRLPFTTAFPLATFFTNVLGAFLIGIIVSQEGNMSPRTSLLLKTGFCGGFTTFSTFSLESLNLLRSGQLGVGLLYMGTSLLACLLGVVVGIAIGTKLGQRLSY